MVIFERDKYGKERNLELKSRLFEDRVIWLTGHIDPFNAEETAQQLLLLDSTDDLIIKFYLNSPGGSVTDGLMIYDIMNAMHCAVDIYCAGQCCSMAAVLLSSATGYRYAYKQSTIMIHQVSAGAFGKEPDLEISLEQTKALNDRLMHILAKNTGKDVRQIHRDTARDNFMSAEQALSYGLIDEII